MSFSRCIHRTLIAAEEGSLKDFATTCIYTVSSQHRGNSAQSGCLQACVASNPGINPWIFNLTNTTCDQVVEDVHQCPARVVVNVPECLMLLRVTLLARR
jgi:hypothetical protein